MSVILPENELMTLVSEFSRIVIYKKQKAKPTMSELLFMETKLNELEDKIDHLHKHAVVPSGPVSGTESKKREELLRLYNKLRLQVTDEIKMVGKQISKHKDK